MAGEVITSLIHKQIESHVQDTCKGSFDVSFMAPLEKVSSNFSLFCVFVITNFAFVTIFVHIALSSCLKVAEFCCGPLVDTFVQKWT